MSHQSVIWAFHSRSRMRQARIHDNWSQRYGLYVGLWFFGGVPGFQVEIDLFGEFRIVEGLRFGGEWLTA